MAGIVETALQHHREGRLADALMLYDLILDGRADPQLVYLTGLACAGLGRHDEALAHFERAVKDAPGRAEFRTAYATALIDAGALDRFQALLADTRDAGLARLGVLKTAGSADAAARARLLRGWSRPNPATGTSPPLSAMPIC